MLVLLLVVVLVGIGCVLWFMHEAMGNERLAVRQKLAEAYRGQLPLVQAQLIGRWNQQLGRLDGAESSTLALRAVCVSIWPTASSVSMSKATSPIQAGQRNATRLPTQICSPSNHRQIRQVRSLMRSPRACVTESMTTRRTRFRRHNVVSSCTNSSGLIPVWSSRHWQGKKSPPVIWRRIRSLRTCRHCTPRNCAMYGRQARRTGSHWHYSRPRDSKGG